VQDMIPVIAKRDTVDAAINCLSWRIIKARAR
jgi:hypothetical protein